MGKKIRRCIGALLMAVAIAITQIPVSDVEAVDTASSPDFQMNGTTLVKYTGTAENVSISNYVEKIEAGAFAGNDSIKSITIGSNVKSIGSGAFQGCGSLQSVTIPDSVQTIEQAAFADCLSLSNVKIGSGLVTLGNAVFAGDVSLSNVDFSSSNPNFTCDGGAIYNKDGIVYRIYGYRNRNITQTYTVLKCFQADFVNGIRDINIRQTAAIGKGICRNLSDTAAD